LFCHNISSFIDFHCAFVCAYCGGFCRTSKHILTHTHRKNSPYFLFLLCFRHFPRFAHSSTFFYQKILYDFTIFKQSVVFFARSSPIMPVPMQEILFLVSI